MIARHAARELAAYQDEPRQLPSGAPGKDAFLRLGFERRGERTALVDLRRRAPLLVQQALYWDEALPELACVFIISNSGGILQGDRQAIEIDLGPGAEAHVTTQAATKIHEMDANYAAQTQELVLAEDAYLEYLPDAIIPHKHSRFVTDTRITIAPSATLLYGEILMPGRKYYNQGELFQYDVFSAKLRAVRPDGLELFVEKFVVEPARDAVRSVGVLGEFDVFGNVVVLTPKAHADRIFDQVAPVFSAPERWAAGASRLPNDAGLIYKVVGMEARSVRAKVRQFWEVVRREVRGAAVPREFLWR